MQVSRNVVYGVGAAFVCMIAIIFFLLGRESLHARRATPNGEAMRDVQAQEPAPSATTSAPDVAAAGPQVTPALHAAEAPASTPSPGDATAVRDYFIKMDSIQAVTGSSDTGEFANTLLTSAMKGDMSGFDSVLKLAQDGADRAREISPPAACRSYHEKMLALVGDGTAMLQQLTDALKRNDTSALAAIAASGNALQARATALEAEGKAIKSRFGITN